MVQLELPSPGGQVPELTGRFANLLEPWSPAAHPSRWPAGNAPPGRVVLERYQEHHLGGCTHLEVPPTSVRPDG